MVSMSAKSTQPIPLVLRLYQVVLGTGLLSTSFGRWMFNVTYTFYKQTIEAPYINMLLQYIPPGSTVVDVGANIGFFTLRFARQVGPQGTIVAIEPESLNFKELSQRVIRASLTDRVALRQIALADTHGKLHLKIDPHHPANHQLSGEGIPVDVTTLDLLMEERGNPAVAFIKIDVQGAELKVLKGAQHTIERCYPALFVEVYDEGLQAFQTSARELIELLTAHGYGIYQLSRKSLQGPLASEEILERQSKQQYSDYLFLHLPMKSS